MQLGRLASPEICTWQAGDPEKLMVQFQSKSQQIWNSGSTVFSTSVAQRQEKKPMSGLKAMRQEEFSLTLGVGSFLFFSGLQLIGSDPPTTQRAICLTQSTDLNVNLIPNYPHRNTQHNIWLPPQSSQVDTQNQPPHIASQVIHVPNFLIQRGGETGK